MPRSQPGLLFQEIICLEQPLVDSSAMYRFGTEQGGQLKKSPCIWRWGLEIGTKLQRCELNLNQPVWGAWGQYNQDWRNTRARRTRTKYTKYITFAKSRFWNLWKTWISTSTYSEREVPNNWKKCKGTSKYDICCMEESKNYCHSFNHQAFLILTKVSKCLCENVTRFDHLSLPK